MQFTVTKKHFLIALFTAITVSTFGQQHKADSLTALVNEMARSNVYETSYTVGYAGTVSKQYERFQQLVAFATEQQLLSLAQKHQNAVVRLYSLQALKRRKVAISPQLNRQFINDKTIVKMLNGCVGDEKPLNVLFEQELEPAPDLAN
jgi:hypothetical protein